jgi:hypothetical protein
MKLVGLAQHGISLSEIDRSDLHLLAKLNVRIETPSKEKHISREKEEEDEDDPSRYDVLFDQYLQEQGGQDGFLHSKYIIYN